LFLDVKSLLTRIGAHCSARTIHRLNAAINFLEAGRWFKENAVEDRKRFAGRSDLFRYIGGQLADQRVLYLEFGVHEGGTISFWSRLLKNRESHLHGFDSFEGLPEDWVYGVPKASFSTAGRIPVIDDPRVKFFKGWFEDTLPMYQLPEHDVLVINCDADLYSSTKTILTNLKPHIRAGTYLYFDEFCDRAHELKAFNEFRIENEIRFRVVGALRDLQAVLFQIV
jgi:hypothetical protein